MVKHEELWGTTKKYISWNVIEVIRQLYEKATSAGYCNGTIGNWCAPRVSALTYPLQHLPGKNIVGCT